MGRDPQSVLFEAEYLKQANEIIQSMNASIPAAARLLMTIPINALSLMLNPETSVIAEQISVAARDALQQLSSAEDDVLALVEMIGGRFAVLYDDAGLERHEGMPPKGGNDDDEN